MPSGVYERKLGEVTEDVPSIKVDGSADAPKRGRGRPPGSKSKKTSGGPASNTGTLKGDAIPEELLQLAGRAPLVIAGVMVARGTKGRVVPQYAEKMVADLVDKPFKKLAESAEVEISPGWAYVIGCALVVGGGILNGIGAEPSPAHTAPKAPESPKVENAPPSHPTESSGAEPPGPYPVPEQPSGSLEVAA